MKKSELIAELQKDIERFGDEYIRSWKIVGENETTESYMISKRKDEFGRSKRMTSKEFADYVKKMKAVGGNK